MPVLTVGVVDSASRKVCASLRVSRISRSRFRLRGGFARRVIAGPCNLPEAEDQMSDERYKNHLHRWRAVGVEFMPHQSDPENNADHVDDCRCQALLWRVSGTQVRCASSTRQVPSRILLSGPTQPVRTRVAPAKAMATGGAGVLDHEAQSLFIVRSPACGLKPQQSDAAAMPPGRQSAAPGRLRSQGVVATARMPRC